MHFKQTAARLTAGLLLVSNLAIPALALSGTVNTGSSTLRVRSEASTSSEVVTKLDNGTKIDVISTVEDGWYQIACEGVTGFVPSDYLVVDAAEGAVSAVSAVAPASAASAASAVAVSQAADPRYGKVTASSLNIRTGPGTGYDKAASLRAGKVVEIKGESNGWYQIDSGYISAEYVVIVDAAEAAQSGKGQEIADFAKSFVGSRYVYGGSSPKGFDCSGFTTYVYKHFGYSINRTASSQMDNGTAVSMSELQPGDLVFFKKSGSGSKRASHVGIYIGGNQFVHASTAKVGVIISNMSDAYYTSGFVGGRRMA